MSLQGQAHQSGLQQGWSQALFSTTITCPHGAPVCLNAKPRTNAVSTDCSTVTLDRDIREERGRKAERKGGLFSEQAQVSVCVIHTCPTLFSRTRAPR